MDNNDINKKFFRKLIERYLDGETIADELKLLVNYYESFQKENEWVEALGPEKIIKERMLINILEAIKEEEKESSKVISLFTRNLIKYVAAASIAVFMAFYFFMDKGTTITEPNNSIVNTSIEVGTDKATLTREDGSNVALEKGKNYASDNMVSDGKALVYSEAKQTTADIKYNYLTIPRGGQFFIKLSDGTQVWLNSESKLKYPVAFIDGQTREVELLYGEAYFDVSPSSKHKGSKFIVNNNNQEIEVLGTEFNVKAYNNEPEVTTTLVEGKVSINYQEENHLLLPNQKSILNTTYNTIEFQEANIFQETSWRKGIFSFDNSSLKDIMIVLARWYDFEVEFKNKAVENELFIGTLGKNDKIENILQNLKDMEVINGFKFDNKNIIIE